MFLIHYECHIISTVSVSLNNTHTQVCVCVQTHTNMYTLTNNAKHWEWQFLSLATSKHFQFILNNIWNCVACKHIKFCSKISPPSHTDLLTIPYSLEEVSQHFRHPAVRIIVKVVHARLTTWHHIPRDSPYCYANLKSHQFVS